jgi:glutathione S-transferase
MQGAMTLILHSHPLASYCWKVLIALHETGLAFEARMVDLGNREARAAFAALWPTAKIPLLQHGDRVVPETSIMIEYLDRLAGGTALLPRDAEAQLATRLWDRLFDCHVMDPMQRTIAQMLRPEAERDPQALAAARNDLSNAYDLVEQRLVGRWAAGHDFTMADCAAAPALFYASTVQPFPSGHMRLAAYFEDLMARPSVRRVVDEARPWFKYYPLRSAIPARFLSDAEA